MSGLLGKWKPSFSLGGLGLFREEGGGGALWDQRGPRSPPTKGLLVPLGGSSRAVGGLSDQGKESTGSSERSPQLLGV